MASEETHRFLAEHPKTAHLAHNVIDDLQAIQNHNQFSIHATRLREFLLAPTLGMDASLRANADWLNDAFTNAHAGTQEIPPASVTLRSF